MSFSKQVLSGCLGLILLWCGAGNGAEISPALATALRCEYLFDPLGIDSPHPRLSWEMVSSQRNDRQTAYQLIVASSKKMLDGDKGDLWDSGQIESNQTAQVEYAGLALQSSMQCYWKVRVWDRDGRPSAWSPPALWSMGLLGPEDWQAQWIGIEQHLATKPPQSKTLDPKPKDNPRIIATPEYLRKDFVVEKPVRRATVYATALGLYELRLNGRRVGDHLLAPEWTSYPKRVQYQTYDVTDLLEKGDNALGAILGNGWYCGLWQHWPYEVRMYGDEPLLMVRLEIERADGSKQIVVSDESWKGTTNGPIRFSGIYEGETYDATKEMPGWDAARFNALSWEAVKIVDTPPVGLKVAQRSPPIRASQEIKPVTLTEPRPGVYVFDFVQNMAGWSRLCFTEKAGTVVSLQYGEMLNKDGTVFTGNLHLFNTADRQLDHYTFKGTGAETFEPHFTYHGFRYVEVRGLSTKPNLDNLSGVVFHTDCPEVGQFTCSDPRLNRLAQNILWSQRANFMGVPTDCPQRDERCGYPGDAQFYMPTAVYNMDVAAFYNKCLVDLCQDSANEKNGAFGDHMPDFHAGGYGNVGWGDAGIICPYLFYQTYGDMKLIREHYEPMRRHLEFWITRNGEKNDRGGIRDSGGPRDWLNLKCPTDSKVIATAYFSYLCDLMAQMAEAIGQPADAIRYRRIERETKQAFAQTFISPDCKILNSSQTGFALAFTMDLVPDSLKETMADQFIGEVHNYNDHLATGFIGTPRLLPGLHQAGRDDMAYQLLLTDTQPSWLYEVKVGATTMWERWDGWDGKTPKGGMNSLNHYAFGAVGQYLYGMIGGIQAKEPGYQKILIEPVIEKGLTWAKTHYHSIHGEIRSDWNVDGDHLTLEVSIPANTAATVVLPTTEADSVLESGRPASDSPEIKFIGKSPHSVSYAVGSGTYVFTARK